MKQLYFGECWTKFTLHLHLIDLSSHNSIINFCCFNQSQNYWDQNFKVQRVDIVREKGDMIRLRHLWTTFALSRSMAFMSEPWKYLTRVCCRFSRPSNSRSGSALEHHNSDSLSQSNYSTMTLTIFQKCTQKLDVNVISQEEMSLLQVRHSIKCHRG